MIIFKRRHFFGFAAVFTQTVLGLLAATVSSIFGQQQSAEKARMRQDRDLSNIVVIGMLTGKNEPKETHIRIDDTEYLISPTENAKPFTVVHFSQDWIDVKLKSHVSSGNITNIAYRYFNSERSLYQALLLSQVDFAILSDDILASEVYRNNPNLRPSLISRKSHTIEMIVYNLNHAIAGNLEVRKAISFALDKKRLVEYVVNGLPQQIGEEAEGAVFEPDHKLFPSVRIEKYKYNLRKARELLEAGGWFDSDNDGVREKNGKKLKINLAYRGGIEFEERIVRDILLACNKIGIEIIGVGLSAGKLKESLSNHNYEAVLWEQTFEENIDAIYHFFTHPDHSFIKFKDQSYKRFYDFAKQSQNNDRTVNLAQGMQRIINEQCVVSFLFFKWYDYAIINTAKIENVRDLKSGQINPVNFWRFTQPRK